jgi:hypothetical protein
VVTACGFDLTGGGDDDDDGTGDDPGDPYVPPFSDCGGGGATDTAPPEGASCFGPENDPSDTDAPPLLVIEHERVTYEGVDAVHVSLIFNPTFADNTYGANAVGWTGNKGHTFNDLVKSDHAQVVMTDASGGLVFEMKLDYLTEDPDAPCGYASQGPFGGEGGMITGDPTAILGWSSSIDRNLNERGYCTDYLVDSPATDETCTANPDAPDWDFRVVYEVWVALWAFDPAGFGAASMSAVHASPAKGGENTITVTPEECPCVEIDPGDCEESPPDGGGCTTDGDCGPGEFCEGGECVVIIG